MPMMHLHLRLNETFKCKFYLWGEEGGGVWPKSPKRYNFTCDWDTKEERSSSAAENSNTNFTWTEDTMIFCVFDLPEEAEEKKVSAADSCVWGENEVIVNPLSEAACLNVSIFHRRHFGLDFSSLIKIWERL